MMGFPIPNSENSKTADYGNGGLLFLTLQYLGKLGICHNGKSGQEEGGMVW